MAAVLTNSAPGALHVDFDGLTEGSDAGTSQSGYESFRAPGTESNTELDVTMTYTAVLDSGDDVTVRLIAQRWKNRDDITGGDETAILLHDLLKDFAGPVNGQTAILSLALPQGVYDITIYHHESRRSAPELANMIVTDADGQREPVGLLSGYGSTNASSPLLYAASIRSDGLNDITFLYDNTDGTTPNAFPVNGFDLTGNSLPHAIDPNPKNNAVAVMPDTLLSWSCSSGTPDSYNLYFGTDPAFDDGPAVTDLSDSFYDPGLLDTDTVYHWRVDTVIDSNTIPGSPWSFTTAKNPVVIRLNNAQPIVDRSFDGVGGNINGPSLIRIPDWIDPVERADPAAVYYLYFANHGGDNIRLAWASNIEGPYTMYNPDHGVLELGISVGNLTISGHIASPNVHIDEDNRRIIMYFHGGSVKWNGTNHGQSTCVATSSLGLDFNQGVEETIVGNFYYRAFEYSGDLYAIAKEGWVWKSIDPDNPWDPTGVDLTSRYLWDRSATNPFADLGKTVRHNALTVAGDTLHVFYSCYPDMPERILHSTIDMSGDWNNWIASQPDEILEPEMDWEGTDLPPAMSRSGSATGVRQLRDPAVFEDIDGQTYLLYSGRGEEAIGLGQFISNCYIPLSGDLTDNCIVDIADLAVLTEGWLKIYDFQDFADLADNWLMD